MERVECRLTDPDGQRPGGRPPEKTVNYKTFVKQLISMAFDWAEEKYGDKWLLRIAMEQAEKLILQLIDDGLIEDLLRRGALTMPAEEK